MNRIAFYSIRCSTRKMNIQNNECFSISGQIVGIDEKTSKVRNVGTKGYFLMADHKTCPSILQDKGSYIDPQIWTLSLELSVSRNSKCHQSLKVGLHPPKASVLITRLHSRRLRNVNTSERHQCLGLIFYHRALAFRRATKEQHR